MLDLLAGRKTVGEQKGEILFSGVRPTMGFLKRYTGELQRLSSSLAHPMQKGNQATQPL